MAITVNLDVCAGPAAGQRVTVNHSHFLVGRHPHAALVLEDPKVSLAHLELNLESDQVRLVNLDGCLFVNHERVDQTTLHDHDHITVGNTDIEVFIAPVRPTPPAPPEEQGVTSLPVVVVPPAALKPAAAQTDERVSLAEIELFHLGDSVYDAPRPRRPAFPAPPRTGAATMRFSKNATCTLVNPYGVLYAVVDAARDLELAGQARRRGYDLTSLFLGDQAAQLADLAPYFFQVPHGAAFLAGEWRAALGKSAGILIDSPASPAEVFAHLRYAFIVKDEAEQPYFFRYYDPRVLRPYLPSCTPEQLAEFFGPVRTWICEDESAEGYLAFTRDEGGRLVQQELGLIEVIPQS
jgi:hypothetical protein